MMNKKECVIAIKQIMKNNEDIETLEAWLSDSDSTDEDVEEKEKRKRTLFYDNDQLLQSVFMSGVDTFTIRAEDCRYYFYNLKEGDGFVLLVIEKQDYMDYILTFEKWYNHGGVFRIEEVETLDLIKSFIQGDIK